MHAEDITPSHRTHNTNTSPLLSPSHQPTTRFEDESPLPSTPQIPIHNVASEVIRLSNHTLETLSSYLSVSGVEEGAEAWRTLDLDSLDEKAELYLDKDVSLGV